jgi:hypothetical protein
MSESTAMVTVELCNMIQLDHQAAQLDDPLGY